ncbi:MAG: hypothetical protein JRF47_14910, partial [Deltaproteobacteria bacterium]|nr:hypothetical protein [Deltaproteobacteria bacterium]
MGYFAYLQLIEYSIVNSGLSGLSSPLELLKSFLNRLIDGFNLEGLGKMIIKTGLFELLDIV